jgi:hypothetical protein
MLDGQASAILQKAIELALKGDPTALRLCLERISPPRKERVIDLPLPQINKARDASVALTSILSGVAEGRITPGEAESLARTVHIHTQVMETEELARRVDELEKAFTQELGKQGKISLQGTVTEMDNNSGTT